MIARIQGVLVEKSPPWIVVDCHGVGYECEVPMSTFYQLPDIGQNVHLLTHYVVREDAHLLYGFGSVEEKNTFKQLMKVNGIGAKSALAILSGLSVNDLVSAVANQEMAMLVRVPGIGKKTAERLLLELKDKFSISATLAAHPQVSTNDADVLNALIALGYHEREAVQAVKSLDKGLSVAEGIKQALKLLSK